MKERDFRGKKPRKEAKDGETTKLKGQIRKLQNENKKLKSELKSYDRAFKQMTKHIKQFTDDFSLEELIDAAKENKKPIKKEKAKDVCPYCFSENVFVGDLPFGGNKLISCQDCNKVKVVGDSNEK